MNFFLLTLLFVPFLAFKLSSDGVAHDFEVAYPIKDSSPTPKSYVDNAAAGTLSLATFQAEVVGNCDRIRAFIKNVPRTAEYEITIKSSNDTSTVSLLGLESDYVFLFGVTGQAYDVQLCHTPSNECTPTFYVEILGQYVVAEESAIVNMNLPAFVPFPTSDFFIERLMYHERTFQEVLASFVSYGSSEERLHILLQMRNINTWRLHCNGIFEDVARNATENGLTHLVFEYIQATGTSNIYINGTFDAAFVGYTYNVKPSSWTFGSHMVSSGVHTEGYRQTEKFYWANGFSGSLTEEDRMTLANGGDAAMKFRNARISDNFFSAFHGWGSTVEYRGSPEFYSDPSNSTLPSYYVNCN